MPKDRRLTVKCGECGNAFNRWRGDWQRNKTDAQLRCQPCRMEQLDAQHLALEVSERRKAYENYIGTL